VFGIEISSRIHFWNNFISPHSVHQGHLYHLYLQMPLNGSKCNVTPNHNHMITVWFITDKKFQNCSLLLQYPWCQEQQLTFASQILSWATYPIQTYDNLWITRCYFPRLRHLTKLTFICTKLYSNKLTTYFYCCTCNNTQRTANK